MDDITPAVAEPELEYSVALNGDLNDVLSHPYRKDRDWALSHQNAEFGDLIVHRVPASPWSAERPSV